MPVINKPKIKRKYTPDPRAIRRAFIFGETLICYDKDEIEATQRQADRMKVKVRISLAKQK